MPRRRASPRLACARTVAGEQPMSSPIACSHRSRARSTRLRGPVGTAIELLAAIPSIIYGMWGLFVLVPFVQQNIQLTIGEALGAIPLVGFLLESRSFAGTPRTSRP